MTRRKECKGTADVQLAVAGRLPWWGSLAFGLASYLILHSIAVQDVAIATSTREIGAVAAKNLYRSSANFGQYILCLKLVVSGVARVRIAEAVATLEHRP